VKEIQCKHYKGDGYGYEISKEEKLFLCNQCHLNLVKELFGQVAIEYFISDFFKNKEVRENSD